MKWKNIFQEFAVGDIVKIIGLIPNCDEADIYPFKIGDKCKLLKHNTVDNIGQSWIVEYMGEDEDCDGATESLYEQEFEKVPQ